MAKRKDILFFVGVMLFYFLVRWISIFGTKVILRFYLTDLLFVPAMCTIGLIGVRYLKNDVKIRLDWWLILIQVILVSLYFEWYLPSVDNSHTADLIDVVMYFSGGLLFWPLQKHL